MGLSEQAEREGNSAAYNYYRIKEGSKVNQVI